MIITSVSMDEVFDLFPDQELPLVRLTRVGRDIARRNRLHITQYVSGHYSGVSHRLPSGIFVKLLIERRTRSNMAVSDHGRFASTSRASDMVVLPKTEIETAAIPGLVEDVIADLGINGLQIISNATLDFPQHFPRIVARRGRAISP